jgi:hypothetical protein
MFSIHNRLMAAMILLMIALGLMGNQVDVDAHNASSHVVTQAQGSQDSTVLFDEDWRFHRGGAQGAEQPDFDDSKWRALDLPHDWSIEELPSAHSPFNPDAIRQAGPLGIAKLLPSRMNRRRSEF